MMHDGKSMASKPIIQFLLDILRFDGSRVQRDDIEKLSQYDWQALLNLASAQRIRSLLYHRLKKNGLLDAVPDSPRHVLREFYQSNAVANLKYYGGLKQLATEFNSNSIPLIVLKGMYLAEAVYGNIALREMNDIDLLVPKDQLAEAVGILEKLGYEYDLAILERLGYESSERYLIESEIAAHHHISPLGKPDVGWVELHWALVRPNQHYSIDEKEIWENVMIIQLAGVNVSSLCPENLLLHICIHTSYHHKFNFSLRPSCDIAKIIEYFQEEIDWEVIQERAERWNWGRGVYLALRVAKELVGADIPVDALASLKPSDFTEDILSIAITQILYEESTLFSSRTIAKIVSQEKGWFLFTSLVKRIFVPRSVLADLYSLPLDSPIVYLFYFVRVKDLAVKLGSKVWQLQREIPKDVRFFDGKDILEEWLSTVKQL